ncbi:glycosyl transferase family 1 [Neptunicella marina]|uniref:Glycosyl transferase family 1 n=2 Tax=Neptunicella marina TaxID=2125989 RepID=A0A8J6ISE6_9ALTE|nr:glycosyl transferase family 1 [Neptunicella marina]
MTLSVSNNLFDATWYQEHYGAFPNDFEAFKDYLYKSTFANVNPSSGFDTEHYLRNNLDIYLQGVSPLLHYFNYGRKENRQIAPATVRWQPKSQLIAKDNVDWQLQNIAICLHIFYDDFVDKFADCLKSFPIDVDVFVAAASQEIKEKVEEQYAQLLTVKKLKVAIVPNRGRNFGPMLVEFGKELLNYDLLCHLHSKKSLYSGREQTQWFDYLNQYLFKDRHVVACMLRLFAEHKNLGMYYPTSFWMMPSWVNHWTCNKPFAKSFIEDWGIDVSDNFLNYPVGGMFWVRPEAIKQLLETNYDYDSFPEEPLPNDGSWLHALERALGLLVEKNNYEQFFYHPQAAKFTQDKSYIFANYYKPPTQLITELQGFEVISFDIFDTILRRKYTEPDFAKFQVGEVLTEQSIVATPQAFVDFRNRAEHEIRVQKKFIGDVNIIEIYHRLGQLLGCDEEQAMSWLELEFSFDLNSILPKDEMVQVLHHLSDLGKEIWLVSDSYYTSSQIRTMLRKIGISAPYSLFLSCEQQLRKDNGTMWKMLSEKVNFLRAKCIHIGDNVRADAQLCGDYGFTNMHILNPVDKWQASGLKPKFKDSSEMDKTNILKWGPLMSNLGRYPFFGE